MKIPQIHTYFMEIIHAQFIEATRYPRDSVSMISNNTYDFIGRISEEIFTMMMGFASMMRSLADNIAEFMSIARSLVNNIDEQVIRFPSVLVPEPHKIRIEHDPDFGPILVVKVETSARRALELWLKLVRRLPGVHVVIEWTGETDVSEDELIDYLVKIALATGHKPVALPGFNAVEAVREERDRWRM